MYISVIMRFRTKCQSNQQKRQYFPAHSALLLHIKYSRYGRIYLSVVIYNVSTVFHNILSSYHISHIISYPIKSLTVLIASRANSLYSKYNNLLVSQIFLDGCIESFSPIYRNHHQTSHQATNNINYNNIPSLPSISLTSYTLITLNNNELKSGMIEAWSYLSHSLVLYQSFLYISSLWSSCTSTVWLQNE